MNGITNSGSMMWGMRWGGLQFTALVILGVAVLAKYLLFDKRQWWRKEENMSYYLGGMLPIAFDEEVTRTMDVLKKEGFGIFTEIDVKETLKMKIGVEFQNYEILDACNPALAYDALKLENKVGTTLPSNVVVRDAGNSQTEVAAIDPVASMQAIYNPALKRAAEQVGAKLERVIAEL